MEEGGLLPPITIGVLVSNLLCCGISVVYFNKGKLLQSIFYLLFGNLIVYLSAVFGVFCVPIPIEMQRPTKAFGIGFGHTGTSALTVALDDLGYRSYHHLHYLINWDVDDKGNKTPHLNKYWASSYDAQLDVHVAILFEEIYQMYPNAKYIYTKARDLDEWAQFMVDNFAKKRKMFETLQFLHDLGFIVPPAIDIFAAAYGEDFRNYGIEQFKTVYMKHEKKVLDFFKDKQHQLLTLQISPKTAKQCWEKLAKFLKIPLNTRVMYEHRIAERQQHSPNDPKLFEQTNVIELSIHMLARWQVENLLLWLGIRLN